jgi:hypothetical protein
MPSNAGKVRSWPMRLRARCIALCRPISRHISRAPPRCGHARACQLTDSAVLAPIAFTVERTELMKHIFESVLAATLGILMRRYRHLEID